MHTDTIAAIATPPGKGGIGIVRVSGPSVAHIGRNLLKFLPEPRRAAYSKFFDRAGAVIDFGIALYFPGPNSFTGEDVLELHGHGGPVVLDLLLRRVLDLGARLARPGEFSERAFLNDKIDLAEAEAIADLIDSASEQAARLAVRSLQGEFSERIHTLVESVVQLRTFVEAAIDFPEEEIDFLSDGRVQGELQTLIRQLTKTREAARQGCLVREGMTVVIAGRPNVGKSTLLNCLTGRDSAIVTEIPGTTRDILREEINIDGMPVHILDTAGLHDSNDIVEREGIRRAWDEIKKADRILLVIDDAIGFGAKERHILAQLPNDIDITVIRNKVDLTSSNTGMQTSEIGPEVMLSAKQKLGLDILRDHLKTCMGFQSAGEGAFMARRRHLDALERAEQALQSGLTQLAERGAGELLAADLLQAQNELAKITGEFTSEDLLDRIFSSFCIGK
jgi:tRNA modification GTPase